MTADPDLDPVGLVLAEVRDAGPTTVAEIATNVGLSLTTVRRALERLEASQLVESEAYQRRSRVYMEP